jgi:hypothetical protein
MVEQSSKLIKLFENINKNLYRTNKIIELYNPLNEILVSLNQNIDELTIIDKKEQHLHEQIEKEIKTREIISLYKKMDLTICKLKEEIDYFYNQIHRGEDLFEKFRSYRTYIFENPQKSQEYLNKLINIFNIDYFTLKFNVVGTINLSEIATLIKGKKTGIDIVIDANNINLIYEELLKSKLAKFRLVFNQIAIYFEKDNVFYIEAPSKKIELCDSAAKEFNAKLLDE